MIVKNIAKIILSIGVASSLTACVLVPAQDYYANDYEYTTTAPPAPQVEVIGVAPSPQHIWINGYWNVNRGRHEWTRGRWERPHHGYNRWNAPRWEQKNNGWRMHRGHWAR